MIALADIRSTTPQLPQAPPVVLSGSGRIMHGTFGIVTKNLLSLGAFAIEDLSAPSKADLEGLTSLSIPIRMLYLVLCFKQSERMKRKKRTT